ncbi:type II toxin-antitoxin system RelE/ParE family toxin [Halomonas sp. DP5N14-9]|uniref:type II toxin-antitoxin system RelE/ParE family toxin n=1 Tax=Halomonas sp. DP5N14-9 TaxID=2859075 RepID=UPI001C99511C|nr:type II toxin-antitoxin system RelE/ParE family toxin [Halomonas sp. DP5N14-9]MBY5943577.1 type II toxin-antitoxin system RelE/ParE family toxin [Halomonas sp. DP5N14-9]
MRVVWTPEAEADRHHAVDYIAEDNPAAALRMDQFISDAAAALASFPIQRFVHNPCLTSLGPVHDWLGPSPACG